MKLPLSICVIIHFVQFSYKEHEKHHVQYHIVMAAAAGALVASCSTEVGGWM